MNLLLIRHGETALNVPRVLQPADTPLSARGMAQAEALAQLLEQFVRGDPVHATDKDVGSAHWRLERQ